MQKFVCYLQYYCFMLGMIILNICAIVSSSLYPPLSVIKTEELRGDTYSAPTGEGDTSLTRNDSCGSTTALSRIVTFTHCTDGDMSNVRINISARKSSSSAKLHINYIHAYIYEACNH